MSRYRQTMAEALRQVRGIKEQDDKDHEISMARGELEAIADKATQLSAALQGKSDEGNPLEAWVQSKITKAKDYINSVSDYMMYKPEEVEESVDDIRKNPNWKLQPGGGMYPKFKHPKHGEINIDRYGGWMHYDKNNKRVAFYSPAYPDNKLSNTGATSMDLSDYMKLKKLDEELEEATYGWTLVSKAKDIAKKFKDNITKAVAEIEKLEKGLSKNPTVDAELRKYNENLEEKYTVVITKKDGTTMELGKYNTSAEAQRYVDQYGKGAKVKKEEIEIEEGKMSDIDALVKDGKSSEEIAKLMKLPVKTVKDILGEEKEVPKGYHRMPDGTIMKDSEHKKEETEKDSKEDSKEDSAKEIAALKDQINILKTKLENEKHRAVKPEPNPKTGEVPLTIGIAAAEFKKDKEKKEEVSESRL